MRRRDTLARRCGEPQKTQESSNDDAGELGILSGSHRMSCPGSLRTGACRQLERSAFIRAVTAFVRVPRFLKTLPNNRTSRPHERIPSGRPSNHGSLRTALFFDTEQSAVVAAAVSASSALPLLENSIQQRHHAPTRTHPERPSLHDAYLGTTGSVTYDGCAASCATR
jgi:hypothetical protein